MEKLDTTIQIRIDKKTKEGTEKTFNRLGLDISTAIRMFLRQAIITNSFPLDISNKELKEFKKEEKKNRRTKFV